MIHIPAQLTRASTLVDGGLSLGFHTQELTPEQKIEVMNHSSQFGHLLFKENEIQAAEIPSVDAKAGGKTPSRVLYGKIFKLYKAEQSTEDFDTYYKRWMDKICNHIDWKAETLLSGKQL